MSRLILMLNLAFLLKTSVFPLVHSYDILFVHNMGTRSHLITLKPIVEELLRRNHSVTSIFFQVFWLLLFYNVFIGPESDHWLCLSVTPSLTHSCLVKLIDVTLAFEDVYSKLVEVVTVAHVDDDNSLVQIWKVKFGYKVKFLFRL